MNTFVEGDVGAAQGVEGKRADHVGRIDERFSCEQSQRSQSEHRLRSVDQRDGFFRLKNQRLYFGATQSICGFAPRMGTVSSEPAG